MAHVALEQKMTINTADLVTLALIVVTLAIFLAIASMGMEALILSILAMLPVILCTPIWLALLERYVR